MRRLAILAVFLCATRVFAEPAADGFLLSDKDKIVFVGDSITAAGQYVNYLDAYLATRFPGRTFQVINSGRSSETLSNLSEADHPGRRPCLFTRFNNDVADFAPTVVVACYGINDGIYHPFSDMRLKAYQDGVGQLIAKARGDLKARLLILTPPIYDSRNPGKEDARPENTYGYKRPFADYDQVMGRYAAWLLTLKEENVIVADLHGPMAQHLKARRQESPNFRMSNDTIHPGSTGHLLMAMAVLKAWHAPALVDEAIIDVTKKNATGAVKDLQITDSVRFTWTSKIPMPTEPSWDPASLNLERFTETLNRHRLVVTGLTGGRYQLTGDGVDVGQFSGQDLAAGIDLTALKKFPTTARSEKVLPLITERRRTGYASFRKSKAGEMNPKRAELDERLKTLCTPVTMDIRIAPVP